ncbi:hypothetical protein N866_11655 [Actinotalea ferrariae CF5-4]|uniref:Uncharacterized protein n=1 Tax=Actinotalea ferrariae CF5-4 TaxID=948458 RepID=A0A021VLK8_9CELL|nr:hypothetical protein [Actinotalea ferrariae]EYR62114.1 hypothetical protein N866_11655 [Actinotalea ferrariae CF5-4]
MQPARRGTAAPRRVPARLSARLPARLSARVAAAWLALLAGVTALGAHAPVLVHRCLPADGLTGGLGIRLALLRPDADCPSGTLAVGGEPGQVMGLLVLVAVPVVVAHLLSLLAAAAVVAGAGVLVRAVGAVLGAVLPTLPGRPRAVVDRPHAVVATVVREVVRPVLDAAALRRGPPVLLGA